MALIRSNPLGLIALIESKLLYTMSALCFAAAENRRSDGFQNRCVRKIIGVKPAFISRVSNATVLEKAGHTAASAVDVLLSICSTSLGLHLSGNQLREQGIMFVNSGSCIVTHI